MRAARNDIVRSGFHEDRYRWAMRSPIPSAASGVLAVQDRKLVKPVGPVVHHPGTAAPSSEEQLFSRDTANRAEASSAHITRMVYRPCQARSPGHQNTPRPAPSRPRERLWRRSGDRAPFTKGFTKYGATTVSRNRHRRPSGPSAFSGARGGFLSSGAAKCFMSGERRSHKAIVDPCSWARHRFALRCHSQHWPEL